MLLITRPFYTIRMIHSTHTRAERVKKFRPLTFTLRSGSFWDIFWFRDVDSGSVKVRVAQRLRKETSLNRILIIILLSSCDEMLICSPLLPHFWVLYIWMMISISHFLCVLHLTTYKNIFTSAMKKENIFFETLEKLTEEIDRNKKLTLSFNAGPGPGLLLCLVFR